MMCAEPTSLGMYCGIYRRNESAAVSNEMLVIETAGMEVVERTQVQSRLNLRDFKIQSLF